MRPIKDWTLADAQSLTTRKMINHMTESQTSYMRQLASPNLKDDAATSNILRGRIAEIDTLIKELTGVK